MRVNSLQRIIFSFVAISFLSEITAAASPSAEIDLGEVKKDWVLARTAAVAPAVSVFMTGALLVGATADAVNSGHLVDGYGVYGAALLGLVGYGLLESHRISKLNTSPPEQASGANDSANSEVETLKQEIGNVYYDPEGWGGMADGLILCMTAIPLVAARQHVQTDSWRTTLDIGTGFSIASYIFKPILGHYLKNKYHYKTGWGVTIGPIRSFEKAAAGEIAKMEGVQLVWNTTIQ